MPSHYGKNPNNKNVNSSSMNKKVKMPKPMLKPKENLSMRQKALMKEHKVHHTKKHMDMMTKLMKEGYCFEQAHQMTMKQVGK